jgi:hypothetical protein
VFLLPSDRGLSYQVTVDNFRFFTSFRVGGKVPRSYQVTVNNFSVFNEFGAGRQFCVPTK